MRLLPILTVNFITTLSFSIVLPFLIILVLSFGGNAFIYGILGASFSFFQLIGAPILGRWSDKMGRRPILIVSHIGTLLSWVILYWALSAPHNTLFEIDNGVIGMVVFTLPLLLLFIARIADGITGGNVSVANAYLVDISSEEDRAQNFGYMAVSQNLGFIVGPLIAGLLSTTSLGLRLPVLFALGIGVLGFFIIVFGIKPADKVNIKDTVDTEDTEDNQSLTNEPVSKTDNPALSFRDVLQLPHLSVLLSINFLVFLAFNFFYISFPPFAISILGWDLPDLGIFYSIIGVFMVISQGPVLSIASKRFPRTDLILFGSIFLGVGFVLFVFGTTFSIYLGALLVSLGNGVLYPSLLAVTSFHGDESSQGQIQGVLMGTGSIASIIALILGGFLFQYLEQNIFYFSAIFMIMCTVLAFRLEKLEIAAGESSVEGHQPHSLLLLHAVQHIRHKPHDEKSEE